MTTPENFKKRQQREAVILMILALLMVVQAFYFNSKQSAQQKCFENKVDLIGHTFTSRGTASEDNFKILNDVVLSVANAQSREDVSSALQMYRDSYHDIQVKREKHPLPPYPPGKC